MIRLLDSKYFKIISILLILIIFSVLLINTKQVNHLRNDIITYFEANNYEEKDLRDAVNTMYVTMADKRSNIIATTNPNRKVANSYSFSETQKPSKTPNTTDEYNILFEITDTNGDKGYTKAEEDVIYSMDLPDYIVPQNAYDEGIDVYHECQNFTKKGKTIACGGIYQEDNKYKFKIIFKEVLNKKDVKASYQFNIKLDKTIEDVVFDVKTIDFDLPGILKLYMAKEEKKEQGTDYTLKVQNNGWTSSTYNYTKWTVTLTDNHTDGYRINGTLYVDFGDYMGFQTDQSHWFDDMKIYKDELNVKPTRYTDGINLINDENEIYLDSTLYKIEEIDNYYTPAYSYLANGVKIDIKNFNNNADVEGVHEWKFEFITKEYSEGKDDIFSTNVKFVDNNNLEANYFDTESKSKKYQSNDKITFYSEQKDINNYGIPEVIRYNLNISNWDDVLEITNIPEFHNNSELHYVMDADGFSRRISYLEKSLEIEINNSEYKFEKYGYSPYSPISGQVSNADPALQKVMKRIEGYTSANYQNCYLKSNSPNPDGDYYWIIISQSTQNIANKNNDGRFEYVNKEDNKLSSPAEWKIYILNAKGQNVNVAWNQRLSNYKNTYNGEYGRNYIESKAVINDRELTTESSIARVNPILVKGKFLEKGFIKWDVKVDLNSMNVDKNYLYNHGLLIYLPYTMSTTKSNGFYYDYANNKIVSEPNNTTTSITETLICDRKTPYHNYDYGECGYLKKTAAVPVRDWYNDEMKVTYTDHNLSLGSVDFIQKDYKIYNNSVYYAYYARDSFKDSVPNDGIFRFSFITYDSAYLLNYNNELYTQKIYVESMGDSYKKGSFNNPPQLYYEVATSAEVTYPKINKKVYDNTENNESITKTWVLSNDVYDSYTKSYNIFEENSLSNNSFPEFFNGKYQFTDKFSINSDIERIIAKNTTIKDIKVYYYNTYDYNNKAELIMNYYKDYNKVEGYYTYCNNDINKKCIRIKFNPKKCYIYDDTSEECSEEKENMENGFELIAEGFNKSQHITIEYKTETNLKKVLEEYKNQSMKTENVNISNKATQFDWNEESNLIQYSSNQMKIELLADLSIDKKVNLNEDINYKKDSTKQEVISTIGYTPSKYLKINDFIDGISNLTYNSNTKKYDKENLSTDINKLTNIRKYIDINNLNIYIKNHYDDDSKYQSIYSNGNFISEYDGSTLEYIDNSNELYKLYLVRSDGKDIPALTDVKITYNMTFNPDKEESYRLNNDYSGGKYYISTNVEGIRTYENAVNNNPGGISFTKKDSILRKLSSQDGNYENRIDSTNHELIAYASNEGAAIGTDYLAPPKIIKTSLGEDSWEITYDINSTGKEEKPKINITDSIIFNIDGNSNYNDEIITILKKYTKYKNIKIYYNGKNTSIDNLSYTIEKLNDNNSISFNDISGTLTCTNTSYNLDLSGFNYGDKVIITYDVDIDYESAIKKMYEKGYIDEKNRLIDTNKVIKINYSNGASNPSYVESFTEKSGSYISVGDFVPTITKSNPSNNNDESTWEVKFNTGIHSKDIKVTDKIKIDSENEELIQVIENSLIIKDLIIKYDNNIIYENGQFINNWKDNITININKLGLELLIKDTENNTFISNNKEFVISYKTSIDEDKYNSKITNGIFSIENSVELEKDSLKSKDVLIKSDVNYDFPMTINKEFVGNNSNLTETNWKYTIESGRLNRDNVNITDSMELGSNFSKYLSISKLKIIENDKVIFDNTSNINNLGNYKLTDNNNDTLLFNKSGHYQFNLNIPKLNKNSKIVVEYTLKVDDNEYIINNEILDNELLIKNKLNVTSADNTNLTEEVNGSSKVTSKLKKKFQFEGYDYNGNPRVRWFIDVNLLSEYTSEELVGKEIIIEDVLSDILELDPSSVRINNRTVTTNSDSIGSTISNDKYKLNTENNTVNIKLLDPMSTPNLEISFTTNCLASITELENYVTLSIDGKKEEIKSKNDISLISPYSFGYIQSREDLLYSIEGKKLLDNKPSNKKFIFRIEEVDKDGNLKENGYYSEVTNSKDGKITFNAITFDEEGLYYYKVKEVPGSNKYIKYDNTEYLLRIKVIESHETFIIDNLTIMNSDSKEIVFNNKTIPKEKNNNNIIVNPKTKKLFGIIVYIIILLIIGTTISRKKTKVH